MNLSELILFIIIISLIIIVNILIFFEENKIKNLNLKLDILEITNKKIIKQNDDMRKKLNKLKKKNTL